MVGKPTLLKLVFFKTTDADWKKLYQPLIDGGNDLLKPHNMKLSFPAGDPIGIPHQGPINSRAGEPGAVRYKCHQALPVGVGIPIIFGVMEDDNIFGETFKTGNVNANGDVGWPPYCILSTKILNRTRTTLVHELIHTTLPYREGVDEHDHTDVSDVFNPAGAGSDKKDGQTIKKVLPKRWAENLRRAYFAYPG